MKNLTSGARVISYLIFLIFCVNTGYAQLTTDVERLNVLSEQFKTDWKEMQVLVEAYAEKHDVPIRSLLPNGRLIQLVGVKNGKPVYYTTDNVGAAATTRADELWTGGSLGLDLDGSNYNGLGVWDGGAVRSTHQEFNNTGSSRVNQVDGSTSVSNHATHVAGTLIAHGVKADAKGMNYNGSLQAYDWTDDNAEMTAAAANGLEISNHSYSYIRGWYWNGSAWTWYGNESISSQEDYLFGFYDSSSKEWDEIAYYAPYYLIVKSAGNDRNDTGDGTHPGDGDQTDGVYTGYDCIGPQAIAKNILTVGAVPEVLNYSGPASVDTSIFSSYGPADDGRIKPDIVGKGVSVYSSEGDDDTDYATYSGTSMSSPNVAGTLALLQQHYQKVNNGSRMRAATLKALVINTADECGDYPGPDYRFGWGLLNAEKAAQLITDDLSDTYCIDELALSNEGVFTLDINSDGTEPLKVTIVWTDPAGSPVSASLDPINPMLVNDLDLTLTGNNTTYYPYKLDRNSPSAAATNNTENDVDNVELVDITDPAPGVYTIKVDHDGTLSGDQQFSIVISGAVSTPPVADDAGISSIGNPVGQTCTATTIPQVQLTNFGLNELTSATINYQVDSEPVQSYNWTGNLESGGRVTLDLSPINVTDGSHTFRVYTTNPNGTTDGNTENDDAISDFYRGYNLTLTITFDNYPQENSWEIRDASDLLIASAAYTTSNPDGSTVVSNLCIAGGSQCYDFIMKDSYGDGMCCSYGEGSYLLVDDMSGTILASGGSFNSEETTNFCLPQSDLSVSIIASTGVSCGAIDDGSATAEATGGSGNYTYSWSNGETGATAFNLSEGEWSVTVSDGAVNSVASVTIADPNSNYYLDADSDGYGSISTILRACDAPSGYVDNADDCDDSSNLVNPDAAEICDGIDNDCDGEVDEDLAEPYYLDNDGDGYGDPDYSVFECSKPDGYVENNTDCNDFNSLIHPGAAEICDGVDNDCDGTIDEGCVSCVYELIDENNFDNGWGIWRDGGSDCALSTSNAYSGTYSLELRDNSSSSVATTSSLDLTAYNNLKITFTYYPTSMDNSSEDFLLQISTNGGTSFTTVEEWNQGDEFENNNRYFEEVIIEQEFTANTQIRFRCDASTNYDWVYIDDVKIEGCEQGASNIPPVAQFISSANCLSVGFTDTSYDGDGTISSWLWNFDDGTSSTDQNPTHVYASAGTYSVSLTVTDNEGLANNSTSNVIVNGLITYYQDSDSDGFGNDDVTQEACAAPTGFVADNTDCDDTDATVYPGAPEICDGKDNDCDGDTDEGVTTTFYEDFDGDGFGNANVTQEACAAPTGFVVFNTDCDDTDNTVYPGAPEVCDEKDNDCDGDIDEGVTTTFFQDLDNDGYGNPEVAQEACSAPAGYVFDNTDCDDTDMEINPGATEVCNGYDDDCDGEVDEGVTGTYYIDDDFDGFGDAEVFVEACSQPTGYVDNGLDCDDSNPEINPDAEEVCDGIDNNCDGSIDEGLPTSTYYADVDVDGYGDINNPIEACVQPSGYVDNDTDCDDGNASVNPGATEICNGIDDDCDGLIDENVKTTYYADADADGFGDVGISIEACSNPGGYVLNDADCNDADATVYPGAPELCDYKDNDCDGDVDEGVIYNTYYADADSDGFGDPNVTTEDCWAPSGYVADNTDCDDADNTVYPGAPEICDEKDNNCDGDVDEGVQNTYFADTDNDGYGDAGNTTMACSAPIGYVADATDCDDSNASVNPGAEEICDDGVDNNCDGEVDEGCIGCTYEEISFTDFESGFGIWIDGGSDCALSSNYPNSGSNSLELRDNSAGSIAKTPVMDWTMYDEITIDFSYYPKSMDNSNEDFWLQISTDGGASFTTAEEWNLGDEFENLNRYNDAVVIAGPFTNSTIVRFRCDASTNYDWVYLDDILISGCRNTAVTGEAVMKSGGSEPVVIELTDETQLRDYSLKVYPNPFNSEINVSVDGSDKYDKAIIHILDITGKTMYNQVYGNQRKITIRDLQLAPGTYFIRVQLGDFIKTEQLIKTH